MALEPFPSIRGQSRAFSSLNHSVWGLGFGIWGLVFGAWCLGFGVWGLGFRFRG
jgi:hypothetical protein